MNKQLPPRSWRGLRSVESMIERAENLLDEGQNLPTDLWLALVWERTDLPTRFYCWGEGGGRQRPGWFFGESWWTPRDVCDPQGVWVRKSAATVERLIPFLLDAEQHSLAHNTFHGFAERAEDTLAALREVRRRIGRLSDGMSVAPLVAIERKGAGRKAKSLFASDPTPISEREVRELAERNADNGRVVPDIGFLDYEGAA